MTKTCGTPATGKEQAPREALITEYLTTLKQYKKEAKEASNIYDMSDKKTDREFVAACYCEDAAWATFLKAIGARDGTLEDYIISKGLGITVEEKDACEVA